jgi:hypothetical protein
MMMVTRPKGAVNRDGDALAALAALASAAARAAGVLRKTQRRCPARIIAPSPHIKEDPVSTRPLGVAVIGAGRIGTLRARLAAKHPSVGFLAISDLDPSRAQALAKTAAADFCSGSNNEVIERPEVNAVFVSTPEGEHVAPIIRALELGKPVLVEKPIALELADAQRIVDAIREQR